MKGGGNPDYRKQQAEQEAAKKRKEEEKKAQEEIKSLFKPIQTQRVGAWYLYSSNVNLASVRVIEISCSFEEPTCLLYI